MSYHVMKDGKQIGPFEESDLRQRMAENLLSPSDLCWRPDMTAWQPLGAILGVTPPALPPPAPGSTTPLFLHISVSRLVLMSVLTFHVYQHYWMYRNWRYVKERDRLKIRPVWRGVFGVFYCHALLRRIHGDTHAQSLRSPSFSPTALATGWVILFLMADFILVGNVLAQSVGFISAVVFPSFLCLIPVQRYINAVSDKAQPGHRYYRWSAGHVVLLVLGIVIWWGALASFEAPPRKDVVAAASPGVVTIVTLDGQGQPTGNGSGFFLTEDGVLATNHHVIDDEVAAEVILANGDRYPVVGVIYADDAKDFAILKIRATRMTPLPLADLQTVEVTAPVIAIGTPKGLDQTVSDGKISAMRVDDAGRMVIQHTAAISEGSSGGPLLNENGEVLGINMYYIQGQSLNFALAIDYLKPVLGNRDLKMTLAEYAADRTRMKIESFRQTLVVYHDPDGLFEAPVFKVFAINRSVVIDPGGRAVVKVVAQSPNAERDGANGWLSDGVRVTFRLAEEGKIWNEEYRAAWPAKALDGFVDTYSHHDIRAASTVTLSGFDGRYVLVTGDSPKIGETEVSYLYAVTAPGCLVTIEVTSPEAQRAQTTLLNAFIAKELRLNCPQ